MTALTHYEQPLLETPFHPRTSAACRTRRWGAWAGYATVLAYDDVAMEYAAIRNAASVYDITPMVKVRISGPDAAAYLDRLTVRSATRLAVGAVHYTLWCDDDGKIIDDGTLFRLGETEYRLCCQERHLPWFLDSAFGYDVAIDDVTEAIAALSLQGPTSAAVLQAAGFDVSTLKPFRIATVSIGGEPLAISRTGFTGDLGYELWTTPAQALALWDRLFAAGALLGIRPIGSEALDIARLEAGFVVAKSDFIPAHQAIRADRTRSPFEMALDWMIDWDKGHFNGRRALLRDRNARSSRWAFVGLVVEGNVPASGAIVYRGSRTEVGVVTGACWSPTLKQNIALAQIDRRFAKDDNLFVEIYALRELAYTRFMARARIAARPFFAPERRRATPPGRF